MGRLFWKFFLVILVAQVVTVTAVGGLFWLHEPKHWPPPPPPGWIPPEARNQQTAPQANAPPYPPGRYGPPPPPPGFREFPLLPIGAGLVASLMLALLLARHMSHPILGLRRAFDAIAHGNFEVRLAPQMEGRQDELADLARDFDHTAEQLVILMDSQRRLLHDVSHEIRSPLARIQLAIDLAQQQPDRTAASIERIQRESDRIVRLVDELLTLSRLEARSVLIGEDLIDVVELIEEIVADARFEASTRNCEIELVVTSKAPARGRVDLLYRAFENIIRNAIAHTFDGTCINITVALQDLMLRIDVTDDGPGIPEIALKAIFEPFVRFREERSKDEEAGKGYGLGLAIARQVIVAHGGSITARNRKNGGLQVSMLLPVAD